ncbi:sodium- and chloride-dependent glycine transporter 2 [Trichonephila inaurata madagascariensis]|uniref:Transporter n=1 Tax=Trichonephila inaurata madagascariensis TaxID=2747483 RepID=A0A8X7C5Z5_9ARAC|nr:sodium- and chloride-dependent glycine transporter 2 [Trichonephila inaurata madagascariensis]
MHISNNSNSIPLPHLDSSSTVSSSTDSENKRSTWSRQLDFFLSCVGYAVGLGNIWRFPYLCYKSGGGAFLVPYFIFLIICGIPLFFLEMSLGQFGSLGPIAIWKISPIFKGVGFGMAIVSAVVCVYYNVIIAWALYYIYQSYSVSWSSCENSWNTPNCVSQDIVSLQSNFSSVMNQTLFLNSTHGNSSLKVLLETSKMTSSEEFWLFKVLQQSAGIESVGTFQWPLVLTLFIAWILIFICVMRGIKSSGKVVYVTATFPYFVLLCLLIRGLTLPGAWTGISFYLSPNWEKLLTFKVWGDAATQIFYSVGAAWGALLTMASYNKFNNNVYRDSLVVPLINCGTSVLAGFVVFSLLGFMAHETGKSVEDVVSEGPGLAFVVYPEAISRLPVSPVWAFLFFFMVFAVGLDTQFGMFETAVSAFVDEYPNFLRKRKTLFTVFLCVLMFILGLPCVTQGGIYVVQLMDWYSAAFSLMVISLLETVAVSWVYGVDRFLHDIFLMTKRMPSVWWKLCWCYITPATIIALLLFILINHTAITYNSYVYPSWSIGIGWIIAMCSITPIPVVGAVILFKEKGNFKQRLINSLRPRPDWGPALEEHRILYKKSISIVSSRFEQKYSEKISLSTNASALKDCDVGQDDLNEVLPLQIESTL